MCAADAVVSGLFVYMRSSELFLLTVVVAQDASLGRVVDHLENAELLYTLRSASCKRPCKSIKAQLMVPCSPTTIILKL